MPTAKATPRAAPPAPRATKLVLHPNGTAEIPLLGGESERSALLPEPSLRQLAEIHSLFSDADKAMPVIPAVDASSSPAEVAAVQAAATARQVAMHAVDSPYATALVKAVEILTGETVTPDDLPGWACAPATARSLIAHWTAPLDGADQQAALLAAME